MRKMILLTLLCLALIGLGLLGTVLFIKTAPKAEKKRPPKSATLVETVPLKQSDETVVLHLAGTLIPAQEIMLRPRVGGEILSVHPDFIEGGLLPQGSELLRIDPTDYELELANAESAHASAQFDYKRELGRQEVAQREWYLLKSDDATELEEELALRKPNLAAIQARLKAAKAWEKRARLNLERTNIRAPFNALVLERLADLGSQAAPQNNLARLVGTDRFHVVTSVPLDRIDWISIPGSAATIRSASGKTREGRVVRLLGNLEPQGRMARVLIEVDDPLCLQSGPASHRLLLGEYVQVEVQGSTLDQVFRIPRSALHNNREIWIAKEGHLDIRQVETLWRDARSVLLRNHLAENELLITSNLSAPIQGMKLNTGNSAAQRKPGAPQP